MPRPWLLVLVLLLDEVTSLLVSLTGSPPRLNDTPSFSQVCCM